MSELAVRILSALVLIAVAAIALYQGGYIFAVLVAAAATAIFYEWTRMTRGWGAGWYLAGALYPLAAAIALLWVRERAEMSLFLTGWMFLVVWSTDIGAYFVGRAMGGAKLAPAISPNKTWAGFYGGVAAATLIGGLAAYALGLPPLCLALAPLFSIVSQCGDLFESWMKRQAGIKDSGKLLPGHGGVFDRLDGLLPVAILTGAAVAAGLI